MSFICLYLPEKKVIAIEKYPQKIDSTGEPWGPRAYLLKSLDRSWLTQQALFFTSLQNIYQKKVFAIEKYRQ